jgi:hypothetical protein
MVERSYIEILSRVLQLDGDVLSPEKAQLVLSLKFSATDHDRMEMLGDLANEGTLSEDERSDYEAYIQVADLLAILQARARLAFKRIGKTV